MAKTPTKKLKVADYIVEKQKHLAHVETYFSRLVKRIGGEVASLVTGSDCEPESLADAFALGIHVATGNNGSDLPSPTEHQVRTCVWNCLHMIDMKNIWLHYDEWINESTINSVCFVQFDWPSLALKVQDTFSLAEASPCSLKVHSINGIGSWSPSVDAIDKISIMLPWFDLLDSADMATYRNLIDREFASLHAWLSTTE